MSAVSTLRVAEAEPGPFEEMSRILDRPPVALSERLGGDTLVTGRWTHGALHDALPGMPAHVIIAHHSNGTEIVLRTGEGARARAQTRPGTIVIIPAGHDGRWDINGGVDVSHVYLTPQRLQASGELLTNGRAVELLDRLCFADPQIAHILTLLSDERANADRSARLFLEQAIDLLCTQLVRAHSSFSALPDPAPKRGLADWQVRRVTTYMCSMLEQDIGLDELAALVNLSRFHFCTAFRLATGQTPHQWLTSLRIARAKEMLADPLLPVTEIALCVGYQTPSSFAASFRKLVGASPSDFRRAL
ncbi:MAG TPA: AraC family transcriptional regulator [Croceibacterium sp.]|nr:AraC family transcriptional regulator [Croceibacterium sp.]